MAKDLMYRKRPIDAGQLVGVRLQPELLQALDDWRRKQPDIPNRSEAVRRMIAQLTGWKPPTPPAG